MTQTSKGFPSKTQGSIRTKYEPLEMSDRLLTRNYHLRGHLFKLGLANNPKCETFQEEDDKASYVLCDRKAVTWGIILQNQAI
jgi:hypothetical protein